MAITAKVRNKQIDTGKVLHALVQGENASGNITFQIIGEEELVEDFNSTYFYLLYTRPSDTRPNVLLLTNKQLQDDVISVTFKPTSYFTAQDGTVQIQIMATDTEGLSIDSETGTISGSVIWQTFPGAMFVHASQLTGTETIIEENVLTQYLAGMQELYSQTEDAEGDAADYAQLAKDWASKTNGAVEGGEMSAKYYAGTADSRAKEAEGYAVGTVSGSPSASFAGKNAKELASDAQDWAKGTRSDGKTPSHTSDNAKAYAESAAGSAAIVSAHAEAIDAIGDDLTNIDAVAADILDDDSAIDAVAANITNVNAVAANETNINAVNTNKTNINTVAGKATEITTVAGIASDVSAVAAIASDVAAVEDIDDDVSAVAAIAVDVGVVADAATDVAAVADGITDVGTVATNISDVGAVASDITKIAAVADDLTNIDAVADDLANIDAADEHALEAEGWANGTQNGTDVGSSSPYYHNNAKYWAGSVPALQSKVEANSKRITNLEQKAGDEIVVDYPSSTYGMDEVPANVAEYAKVSKLRGVSRVDNSFVVLPQSSATVGGLTVTFYPTEHYYTISNGTPSQSAQDYFMGDFVVQVGHKYLIADYFAQRYGSDGTYKGNLNTVTDWSPSIVDTTGWVSGDKIRPSVRADASQTYSVSKKYYPILKDLTIYFGGTIPSDADTIAEIQTNYPHLLLPSDYGTRIVDSSYSGVRAWGVNLIDASNLIADSYVDSLTGIIGVYSGVNRTDYMRVKGGESYFFGGYIMANKGNTGAYFDINKNFLGAIPNDSDARPFVAPANCAYVVMNFWLTNWGDLATTAYFVPYDLPHVWSPYMESTLSFPSTTLKSAGSVREKKLLNVEVEIDGQKVQKSVKTNPIGEYTITGSEVFTATGAGQYIWLGWASIAGTPKIPSSSAEKANLLCSFAVTRTYQDANVSGVTASIAVRENGWLLITSDIQANWANLAGQKISYELATPNPDTYSDPILDPFIKVEGGGTIRPIQTQTPEVDSAMTAEYLAV